MNIRNIYLFASQTQIILPKSVPKYFNSADAQKLSTHYEILDLKESANMDEVQQAYFAKVQTCHPDHNPNDQTAEESFKQIVAAYETLKDPAKRQIYDLGLRNPNFNESAEDSDYSKYYQEQSTRPRGNNDQPYYDNQWYGFRKPQENLRDEYENEPKIKTEQIKWVTNSIFLRVSILLLCWIAYDLRRFYLKKKHSDLIKIQRELLDENRQISPLEIEIQNQSTTTISLEDYIQLRQSGKETNNLNLN